MTTTLIKDQKCYFGAHDFSPTLSSLSLVLSREAKDDTTLGADTRSNCAGLKDVAAEMAGFFDASVMDGNAAPADTGSRVQLSFLALSETRGDPVYTFLAETASYEFGATVGDLLEASIGGVAAGELMRGQFVARGAISDGDVGDTVTPAVELGAVSAGEALFVVIHDFDAASAAGAFTVAIESGASEAMDGGGEPNARAAAAPGPISDTWFRVVVSGDDGATSDAAIILGKRKI